MQAQEWQVVGVGRLDGQDQKLLREALREYALKGYVIREVWLHPTSSGNNKLLGRILDKPRPKLVIIQQSARDLIKPCWWSKFQKCNIKVLEIKDGSQVPEMRRLDPAELTLRASITQ